MDIKTRRKLIHIRAEKYKNKSLLGDYKSIENTAIKSYLNNNSVQKILSAFDISVLPKAQKKMANSLFLSNNEFKPVLIDMMLNHKSVVSYSIYKMLYQDSPELIIEYDHIFENDATISDFLNKGGNTAALAEMNAELWLNSPIGEKYIFGEYN